MRFFALDMQKIAIFLGFLRFLALDWGLALEQPTLRLRRIDPLVRETPKESLRKVIVPSTGKQKKYRL